MATARQQYATNHAATRWTVFLDRDGVLNQKLPEDQYVTCWDEFQWIPGAKQAVRLLKAAGARTIVVTNQRGVARGLLSEADLRAIHQQMQQELSDRGPCIDRVYYCPHDDGQCDCRKPAPGMLTKAATDFPGLDFARSVMVGDSLCDVQAAREVGCRAILVGSPPRRAGVVSECREAGVAPFAVAESLLDACFHHILPVVHPSLARPA